MALLLRKRREKTLMRMKKKNLETTICCKNLMPVLLCTLQFGIPFEDFMLVSHAFFIFLAFVAVAWLYKVLMM